VGLLPGVDNDMKKRVGRSFKVVRPRVYLIENRCESSRWTTS
jgi:hypothetical protein